MGHRHRRSKSSPATKPRLVESGQVKPIAPPPEKKRKAPEAEAASSASAAPQPADEPPAQRRRGSVADRVSQHTHARHRLPGTAESRMADFEEGVEKRAEFSKLLLFIQVLISMSKTGRDILAGVGYANDDDDVLIQISSVIRISIIKSFIPEGLLVYSDQRDCIYADLIKHAPLIFDAVRFNVHAFNVECDAARQKAQGPYTDRETIDSCRVFGRHAVVSAVKSAVDSFGLGFSDPAPSVERGFIWSLDYLMNLISDIKAPTPVRACAVILVWREWYGNTLIRRHFNPSALSIRRQFERIDATAEGDDD